jgi:hypothetical protein
MLYTQGEREIFKKVYSQIVAARAARALAVEPEEHSGCVLLLVDVDWGLEVQGEPVVVDVKLHPVDEVLLLASTRASMNLLWNLEKVQFVRLTRPSASFQL